MYAKEIVLLKTLQKLSDCKESHACLVLKEDEIIGTGVNSNSASIGSDLTHTIHAEENMLSTTILRHISLKDGIVLSTSEPSTRYYDLLKYLGIKQILIIDDSSSHTDVREYLPY